MKKPVQQNEVPLVQLHPLTIKAFATGHPWVTKDSYTESFPKHTLWAHGGKVGHEWCFLNDPSHPHIKGRLWKKGVVGSSMAFWRNFTTRLKQSIEKRDDYRVTRERDNYYYAFGEADELPGLHILKLGDRVLFLSYAYAWEKHQGKIIDIFKSCLPRKQRPTSIWWQTRGKGKQKCYEGDRSPEFVVQEFGLKYLLKLGQANDFGIYTDLSSFRGQIMNNELRGKKVLNLFSYTGALSLRSLQLGAEQVTSVDLSPQNMSWLDKNLELNSTDIDRDKHRSLQLDILEALELLVKEGQVFDFIFCDPPSTYTDGKTKGQAFREYQLFWPFFEKLMKKHSTIWAFLNTHSISRKKFRQKLKDDLAKGPKVIDEFFLDEDCPLLPKWPEGDYLKGLGFKV